ncbi:MAG: hypothetical protein Q7S52_02605 [bacterium]|nr:hypothetical protein [bacterium]
MDQEQNTVPVAPAGDAAPKKSPTVLIVGAVIILVIVAWFVLMSGKVDAPTTGTPEAPGVMMGEGTGMGMPVPPGDMGMPPAQGTSDEVSDIEADLNATDLNSLDEVDQI